MSALRAVCDTLVPRLDVDGEDPTSAFLRSGAVDLRVDVVLEQVVPTWPAQLQQHVRATLAFLGQDFADSDRPERESRWRAAQADPVARPGTRILQNAVIGMSYTLPDASGSNPAWAAIGYPGPLADPPSAERFPKTLARAETAPDLHVDAVVVGSGAGGGVMAARLAAAGLSVVVAEKGSYRNESDFEQLEATSLPRLYLTGGFVWTVAASAAMLAGSTVGGGTTVNSMACIPPPGYVLREWQALGMADAHPEAFAPHVAGVMRRINAVTDNTVHNPVNEILNRGFDAAGLRHEPIARNAKDARSAMCGECNAGCLTGCKQSTMKTFLQDASDDGAVLLADFAVSEVLHVDGRATGVRGLVGSTPVTVHAPTVVLAAGALSTPTILQSSGLGGPATGRNLHIHPTYFMSGVFQEVVDGWAGQILTSVCHEFDHVEGDRGFVVEAAPMSVGSWTSMTPWHDGETHKREQLRLRHVSGAWAFVRDHGSGSVELGTDGLPQVTWDLDDPVDLAVVRRAHVELARILRAAGAKEVFTFLPGDPRWREGEDFETFLDRFRTLQPDDVFTLSAHQSGSCATGTDPATSVVDGRGGVHGVVGVWVADTSALPTAPGVNPMVAAEAFASRTAELLLADLSAEGGRSVLLPGV